jgi:hypothetical protein
MSEASAMAKVVSDVERFGWHCLHVYPRVGQEGVGFTYTIGLSATLAHPEIAIFGLDRDRSHRILADCVHDIRNGTRYPLGEPIKDVVGGDVPVIFRAVRAERLADCFGTATRYYGNAPFSATVMFWPTREGRWPWEIKDSIQKEGLDVV